MGWATIPSISLASDEAPSISFPYELRIPISPTTLVNFVFSPKSFLSLLLPFHSSCSQPHSFFVNSTYPFLYLAQSRLTLLELLLFASLGLAQSTFISPFDQQSLKPRSCSFEPSKQTTQISQSYPPLISRLRISTHTRIFINTNLKNAYFNLRPSRLRRWRPCPSSPEVRQRPGPCTP